MLQSGVGKSLPDIRPFLCLSTPASATEVATYDLELSKQYNLKHYYGWVGEDCREDVAVVLHPPDGGKPVILNSKEAEKLSPQK